jgi:outer membrane scaffolding protein for murein synthesis (MipA/OmpV family)
MDKLSVSVGNIWYALDGAEDTKEVYLGLTADVLLSPEFKVYYDYDMAKEDGLFYTASVGHTFDLSEKLSLSLGALVSYNQESDYAVYYYDEASDSDKTFSDWHNYELSASLTYALTDQLSITPSFLFSSPISDEAKKAIDSEVLGGVTVSFSF